MAGERNSDLLAEITTKITGEGLQVSRFQEIRHVTVAPGWTVAELVDTSIDAGNFEWKDGKLILSDKKRTVEGAVFSQPDFIALHKAAKEQEKDVRILIRDIVLDWLQNRNSSVGPDQP